MGAVKGAEISGRRGAELRRLGRREEALAVLQKAVALEPSLAWPRAVMGEVLRELGARRRGYAEIQKAIQLNADPAYYGDRFLAAEPDYFDAWICGCRGGAQRSRGDLEGAAQSLLAALRLDVGCGWTWGWLGEIYLRLGRHEEADAALTRAIGFFAEWPEAFAWRGEARRILFRGPEAMRDLDHAVALGYKQYDVYLSRGAARQSAGDSAGYLADLAAAVRSAPETFRKQAAGLADKAASRWIAASLEKIGKASAMLARAEKNLGKDDLSGALKLLRGAEKVDPGNAAVYSRLSETHSRLQDKDEAMRCADRAIALDPTGDTYAHRADLAQRYGYLEASLRDISVALLLAPNTDLYKWRARIFLGMRHYDLALKDISTALQNDPDNAEMYDLRAHVNLILGRLAPAQADVENALKVVPGQVNLHLRLAQILALRGRCAAALASLAPIRRASPAWAEFAAGYVHSLEKRWGAAAESFARALTLARGVDSQLKLQANFYGTVVKAFSGLEKEDSRMKNGARKGAAEAAEKGKVYLCGLGVYPPQTATVEVLRGISECDVVFNNLPGMGISEFLGLFCANRRPVAFRYEQDAKLCADLVLSEVRPGRTVGFITFGHPLLFGPLSHEIISRCAREKIPCKAFGAVSSMDAVLAASGQVLGFSYAGFQLFETTGDRILREIPSVNPRIPVIVYFAEGMGDQGMLKLSAMLSKIYSPNHGCLLYGPKHELWETDQERITLKALSKISHHKLAQGILFVPPLSK